MSKEMDELRRENKWLKGLLLEKGGPVAAVKVEETDTDEVSVPTTSSGRPIKSTKKTRA